MPGYFWGDLSSKAFAALPRDRLIAVLPVAAIEQHGPHLPLSVDFDILNGLIAAAAQRLPPTGLPVLFLPTQPVGKSNEHARYPGTLTLSAETLIRLWMELGDSVAASGVRKLVLFNSHGGQMSVLDIVARDLRARHGMLVVASNWYALGLPDGLFDDRELRHGVHGGALETAMMLALHPERVDMREARDFASLTERMAAEGRHLSLAAGGKLGWQSQDLNPQGAAGDARGATAEIGRQVIDHVADRFVELLGEVDRFPLERLRNQPAW